MEIIFHRTLHRNSIQFRAWLSIELDQVLIASYDEHKEIWLANNHAF
jgi:hypothetical protein